MAFVYCCGKGMCLGNRNAMFTPGFSSFQMYDVKNCFFAEFRVLICEMEIRMPILSSEM